MGRRDIITAVSAIRAIGSFFWSSALLLLAVAFLISSLMYLYSFFYTAHDLSKSSFDNLEESIQRTERILSNETEMPNSLNELDSNLKKIISFNQGLDPQAEKVETLISKKDRLGNLAVQLATIKNELEMQRQIGASAISQTKNSFSEIKEKVKPPTPFQTFVVNLANVFGTTITQIAFPLIILIIFFYLIVSKKAPIRLQRLFSPFKTVKLFNSEFVLADEIKLNMEETFRTYRNKTINEFDLWVQQNNIEDRLRKVSLNVFKKLEEILAKSSSEIRSLGVRATIHVPDTLFSESLYQLVDYFPDGAGRGRVWSSRFGIIGKAWRTGKRQINGEVTTDTEKLIEKWGMTIQEAERAGSGRQTFLCVPLAFGNVEAGIFYIDIKDRLPIFDNDSKKELLEEFIIEECRNAGLTMTLANISKDLKGKSPLIRIYHV
jgi:hypothetical protein